MRCTVNTYTHRENFSKYIILIVSLLIHSRKKKEREYKSLFFHIIFLFPYPSATMRIILKTKNKIKTKHNQKKIEDIFFFSSPMSR